MQFLSALLLSSVLAAAALWRRALTPGGTALAWALCVAITALGGGTAFAVLAVTLLGTVAADRFAGGRADPLAVRRKSGSRDAARVVCNVGVAACAMGLFGVTGNAAFRAGFCAVMAESLADSLASKLGPLAKAQPRDICTGKPVHAGLSGGVTPLGTLSELFGAAAVAAVSAAGYNSARLFAVVLAAGFLGAVFDSVLGSRAQVKLRCRVCGTVTERETHCGEPTLRVSGIGWVTNDAVNLRSNALSLAAALALFAATKC